MNWLFFAFSQSKGRNLERFDFELVTKGLFESISTFPTIFQWIFLLWRKVIGALSQLQYSSVTSNIAKCGWWICECNYQRMERGRERERWINEYATNNRNSCLRARKMQRESLHGSTCIWIHGYVYQLIPVPRDSSNLRLLSTVQYYVATILIFVRDHSPFSNFHDDTICSCRIRICENDASITQKILDTI